MQCSNCGQEIVTGAEFCGNCGAKLVTTIQAVPTATVVPVSQPQSATTPLTQSIESIEQQPVSGADTTPAALTTPIATGTMPTAIAVVKQPRSGLSITGMVLGILALLSSFIWLIAIPFAIASIIFSAIGMSKGGKGMAITGLILSALAIIGTIIITIALLGVANNCSKGSTDNFCKGYSSTKSVTSLLP